MGRPVGSTSGCRPTGGYPAIGAQLNAFLAGFVEAEGCFAITRQPRGMNHACRFTLSVRDDDSRLLRMLANATRLGTIRPVPARGTSKPQLEWDVQNKSDCGRLVDLLYMSPPRGRKSGDFAIWSAAVAWWIGGDASKTTRNRDWAPMAYLRQRLSDGKSLRSTPIPIYDPAVGLTGDWPDYIAGLFAGEGTLGIHVNGKSLLPRAQITMRRDDKPLLAQVQRRTGIGRLNLADRKSPSATWSVRDQNELLRVIEIFDRAHLHGRSEIRQYRGPGYSRQEHPARR